MHGRGERLTPARAMFNPRYRWLVTVTDPPRPICPVCQTPLIHDRQTRTVPPDQTQTATTEQEFDVWVCPTDRTHEAELHITDI